MGKDRCCARPARARRPPRQSTRHQTEWPASRLRRGRFCQTLDRALRHVRTYDLTGACAAAPPAIVTYVVFGGALSRTRQCTHARENGKTKIRAQTHSRTDGRREVIRSRSGTGAAAAHRRGTLHWRAEALATNPADRAFRDGRRRCDGPRLERRPINLRARRRWMRP